MACNAPQLEQYDNYVENEDYDQNEEDENLLPHRHAAARSTLNFTTAINVRPCFPNDTHVIFLCLAKYFLVISKMLPALQF